MQHEKASKEYFDKGLPKPRERKRGTDRYTAQTYEEEGAAEAFRGFINIFDDHLATDLLSEFDKPVHLIWGELDTWEPIEEAKNWKKKYRCIESLVAIKEAGHCPHDEKPEEVNEALINIINHKR